MDLINWFEQTEAKALEITSKNVLSIGHALGQNIGNARVPRQLSGMTGIVKTCRGREGHRGILQEAPGSTDDFHESFVGCELPEVKCVFLRTAGARNGPAFPFLRLPLHHAVNAMFAHRAVALGGDARVKSQIVVLVLVLLGALHPLTTVAVKDKGQPGLVELGLAMGCWGFVREKHGWSGLEKCLLGFEEVNLLCPCGWLAAVPEGMGNSEF